MSHWRQWMSQVPPPLVPSGTFPAGLGPSYHRWGWKSRLSTRKRVEGAQVFSVMFGWSGAIIVLMFSDFLGSNFPGPLAKECKFSLRLFVCLLWGSVFLKTFYEEKMHSKHDWKFKIPYQKLGCHLSIFSFISQSISSFKMFSKPPSSFEIFLLLFLLFPR